MCWWIKKQEVTPTELYPNPLPIERSKVIEELEYDITIHEAYAAWVVQDPARYPPSTFGDYNWHIRWIQVYESAIYYLKQGGEEV